MGAYYEPEGWGRG